MSASTTRQSLHGIAEYVLAGPQYALSGTIRLRATEGGFGTVADPVLRVEADVLVVGAILRIPLKGHTYRSLAGEAGFLAADLRSLYSDGPVVDIDDEIQVDPAEAKQLAAAFAAGVTAIATLDGEAVPVLWPEHFDISVTIDEVNYGVSAADSYIDRPYAYVGPQKLRQGDFWNAPFGAAVALDEVPDAAAVSAFFSRGQAAAATDPIA
ncbi:hypothetical protein SAMN05892883_0708 [Jatrophihabitans sp. GAS493]|uniref:hypothetical protein n=1 Tax=Jatrophihabitans sp. GAS493 TaxID=1907575 RepID=UPI000BB94ABD|nr:hypothetical protein [Jatrophihabitans sp. GAS493]SOD71124.1 hypothetical protein SAMN05892883_0708 [Jatrophihabitans sp. GAS493]